MSEETFAGEPLDPYALKDELTRLRADLAAVTAERDRMREALEEIQNPIEAMQKRADAENAKLNGSMAKFLAENANYLRGIARAAIEGVKEPANTQIGAGND